MIYDVVVDTLFEENLAGALKTVGGGRLIMDREDPQEPFLTAEGYLIVRIRDRDPVTFSRELERRAFQMRIVTVVDRTPKPKE